MIQTPVTCVLAIVGAFPWDSKTDGNIIVMHILGKYWVEQILGQNLLAFEVSPQVHCHRVSRPLILDCVSAGQQHVKTCCCV